MTASGKAHLPDALHYDTPALEALSELRALSYTEQVFCETPDRALESFLGESYERRSFWGFLKDYVPVLAHYGLAFTASALTMFYKGFIWVFCNLLKLLWNSTRGINRYLEKRQESYSVLKSRIKAIEHALAQIKSAKDPGAVTDLQTYRLLVSDVPSLTEGTKTMSAFMKQVFLKIGKDLHAEYQQLTAMVSSVAGGYVRSSTAVATSASVVGMLRPSSLEGYELDTSLHEGYEYGEPLPGGVKFFARWPRNNLDNSQYATAVNSASLFIALSTDGVVDNVSARYMGVKELAAWLKQLNALTEEMQAHKAFYDIFESSKHTLVRRLRNYIRTLAERGQKTPVSQTLIEPIHLKSLFINRVYLAAAIDVQSFVASRLSQSLNLAEKNLRALGGSL